MGSTPVTERVNASVGIPVFLDYTERRLILLDNLTPEPLVERSLVRVTPNGNMNPALDLSSDRRHRVNDITNAIFKKQIKRAVLRAGCIVP